MAAIDRAARSAREGISNRPKNGVVEIVAPISDQASAEPLRLLLVDIDVHFVNRVLDDATELKVGDTPHMVHETDIQGKFCV